MSAEIRFATSMNLIYCRKYGHRLVETFLRFVEPPTALEIHHEASAEGCPPSLYLVDGRASWGEMLGWNTALPGAASAGGRVSLVDLYATGALSGYLALARERVMARLGLVPPGDPDARVPTPGYDYRWDAVTFGKKAFAVVAAARRAAESGALMFWVDADVVFLKPMTEVLLRSILPCGVGVAYYARTWPHTDCGFFGIDLAIPGTHDFVEDYATYWEAGRIFELADGWTDCHAFDAAISRAVASGLRTSILSATTHGHVIAHSPLGQYIDHQKGPRKREAVSGRGQTGIGI